MAEKVRTNRVECTECDWQGECHCVLGALGLHGADCPTVSHAWTCP